MKLKKRSRSKQQNKIEEKEPKIPEDEFKK